MNDNRVCSYILNMLSVSVLLQKFNANSTLSENSTFKKARAIFQLERYGIHERIDYFGRIR